MPENRSCRDEPVGVIRVPTNTQAALGSSTIVQMFINQGEAKRVAGWSVLSAVGHLAFISVPGAAWELQVGTVCPTVNLKSACGREGLHAVGFTVTSQALWSVSLHTDLGSLPTHPCLSQKVASLPPAPNERISASSTSH